MEVVRDKTNRSPVIGRGDNARAVDEELSDGASATRGQIQNTVLVVAVQAARDLGEVCGETPVPPHLPGQPALKTAPLAVNIEAVFKARSIALDAGE